MKKRFLYFLALVALAFNVKAERINIPGLAVPKLIISEVRPDNQSQAYVEITNMGDTAINLEPFTLHSVFYNTRCREYSDSAITFNRMNGGVDNTIGKVFLEGVLQPGESFVVANVWDADNARGSGIPQHNTAIAQIGNQFAHRDESLNQLGWIDMPEWQTFGRDSVTIDKTYGTQAWLVQGQETAGYLLHWVFPMDSGMVDSTYIDQFNHFWYPDENAAIGFNGSSKGPWIYPIAGVVDAITENIMVRKADVEKGNLNWNQSRGTDAATSEWLVIPKYTSNNMAFPTVGTHGDFDLDYSVKDPETITVNAGAKTVSVPWEMVRGDSLARYFNLGDGMSWSYDQVGIFEDSASYIARPDDVFGVYAVGNEVKSDLWTVEVREPEPDVALVFPRRRLIEEIVITDDGSGTETGIDTVITIGWSTGFAYALAEGPEIDSIINVGFATRTDTLLKYLDKPEKASWEFVFVDGIERVDLKFGDKLKVTSENGATVKEYFVVVNDHVEGDNATLNTVTWPDVDKTLYPRWNMGDTLPEFTQLKTEYIVDLRFDAKQIPAFQFKTEDLRAKIDIKNATDIDGTKEQRTTSVTVTSESDTISLTYNFVFQKQGTPVQPNVAEPFVSELIWSVTTQGYALEIYNPGTEELDLSQYVIVKGAQSQTWQEAVETLAGNTTGSYTSGDGLKVYNTHYVPSKRWAADRTREEWSAIPDAENPYIGKGFLIDDNQTDPFVEGGDVWVLGVGTSANEYQTKIRQESDFIFRGSTADNTVFAWDSTKILHRSTIPWGNTANRWLLKIMNDSIIDGTKDVRDASAYELIDRLEFEFNDSIAGRPFSGGGWTLMRKPSVTQGSLERIGGGHETAESSEWIAHKTADFDWNNTLAVSNIGVHVMNPITNYLSTVTSVKFIVTPGYSGSNLSITGSIAEYTPTTITPLLDKADASQVFVFKRGNTVVGADEKLVRDDVLEVTSGDGKNTTVYTLVNSPLNGDVSLSAKDGSALSVDGTKVMGATLTMTLKEVVADLEVAETSLLYVKDAKGALQPLQMHNRDTLVYDVMVSDQVFIEVVAQNSDKAMYSFDFGLANSDAVLFSNVLMIDQDEMMVMELPDNSTAPSMLNMLYANQGATLKILDKSGMERSTGFMNVDDRIEVTAPDGVTKVIYRLSVDVTVSVPGVIESSDKAFLYPNPVTNVLNIEGVELATVNVYSLTGTLMISQSAYTQRIDVSKIPSGIYVVQMIDVKGNATTDKFLKKK